MKQCFLICKSMYSESVFNTLYTLRQNTNVKKNLFQTKKNGTKTGLFFLS